MRRPRLMVLREFGRVGEVVVPCARKQQATAVIEDLEFFGQVNELLFLLGCEVASWTG